MHSLAVTVTTGLGSQLTPLTPRPPPRGIADSIADFATASCRSHGWPPAGTSCARRQSQLAAVASPNRGESLRDRQFDGGPGELADLPSARRLASTPPAGRRWHGLPGEGAPGRERDLGSAGAERER